MVGMPVAIPVESTMCGLLTLKLISSTASGPVSGTLVRARNVVLVVSVSVWIGIGVPIDGTSRMNGLIGITSVSLGQVVNVKVGRLRYDRP
jgi:hypothetical protein